MPRSVAGHAFSSRRRSLVGWGIGVAALAGTTMALYPALPDTEQLRALLEAVPPALLAVLGATVEDLLSPAGYLNGRLFSLLAPLVLLIFGIGAVVRTTADEEDRGTLELLLANPVSRRRIVVEKAVAVAGLLAVLVAVHLVVLVVAAATIDFGVTLHGLVAVHIALFLLVAAFSALALVFAAGAGRRGPATGASAAVAVAAYLLDSLAPLVEALGRIQPLSPFYLYNGNEPLINGLDLRHATALGVLALGLTAVATWCFDRRDIGT